MRFLTLSALFLLASQSTCFAWSTQGHRIIAQLAWERMSSTAKANAQELLERRGFSFVSDADWADRVRRSSRFTAKWHYVDIPFEAQSYEANRDCPDQACIIAQLEKNERTLSSRGSTPDEKTQALLFVIHFVGDIHQPLHCIDREDKGGNAVKIVHGGRTTNLHSFWDQNLVAMQGHGAVDVVQRLRRNIGSSGAAAAWESGEARSWANESHQVGRRSVYTRDTILGTRAILDDKYVATNSAVVGVQLEKAGVRLAWMLNRLFR